MGETVQSLDTLVRPHVPENPLQKCRLAVDAVAQTLSRYGIDHTPVEGSFRGRQVTGGEGVAPHWFLEVPPCELSETFDQPLILDPTIHQFRRANYDNGRTDTFVPAAVLPQEPYVITPDDEVYHAYSSQA